MPQLALDEHGALVPTEAMFDFVRGFLTRHQLLAANSSIGQVRALLHVFKTISLAHAAYRPAGPVAAPIRLFIAEELPARGVRLEQREEGWGWPAHTTGHVEVVTVPGNHIDMLNEPHVLEVADRLRRFFEESDAKATPAPTATNPTASRPVSSPPASTASPTSSRTAISTRSRRKKGRP